MNKKMLILYQYRTIYNKYITRTASAFFQIEFPNFREIRGIAIHDVVTHMMIEACTQQ